MVRNSIVLVREREAGRKGEKEGKCELAEGKEVKGFQQSNEWPQCIKTAEVHEIRPETDSYSLSNKLRVLVDTV